MKKSIQSTISNRLRRKGRGTVFTVKDFLDIGNRDAIDQALSRLCKAEKVRRLGRGLYHYPKINKRLGIVIPPNTDVVAEALARQTGSRIVPSGATAANRLGLSTQVPAKPVYLTDGLSRTVRIGNIDIVLKHSTPKELPIHNPTSASVIQALRYLGKNGVDANVIEQIRQQLTPKSRAQLLQDARYTTDWIADVVRKIAKGQAKEMSHG